jgi:hypothetical protein
MMKYKLNREKLNEIQRLLLDLQDDADSVWDDYGVSEPVPYAIQTTLNFVVDQMNRVAGHKLAEQKNANEQTGWIGQMLDEERDGL